MILLSDDMSNPRHLDSIIMWRFPITPLNFFNTESSSSITKDTATYGRKDGYKSVSFGVSDISPFKVYCQTVADTFIDLDYKVRLYCFKNGVLTELTMTESGTSLENPIRMFCAESSYSFDYASVGVFGDIKSVTLFG